MAGRYRTTTTTTTITTIKEQHAELVYTLVRCVIITREKKNGDYAQSTHNYYYHHYYYHNCSSQTRPHSLPTVDLPPACDEPCAASLLSLPCVIDRKGRPRCSQPFYAPLPPALEGRKAAGAMELLCEYGWQKSQRRPFPVSTRLFFISFRAAHPSNIARSSLSICRPQPIEIEILIYPLAPPIRLASPHSSALFISRLNSTQDRPCRRVLCCDTPSVNLRSTTDRIDSSHVYSAITVLPYSTR